MGTIFGLIAGLFRLIGLAVVAIFKGIIWVGSFLVKIIAGLFGLIMKALVAIWKFILGFFKAIVTGIGKLFAFLGKTLAGGWKALVSLFGKGGAAVSSAAKAPVMAKAIGAAGAAATGTALTVGTGVVQVPKTVVPATVKAAEGTGKAAIRTAEGVEKIVVKGANGLGSTATVPIKTIAKGTRTAVSAPVKTTAKSTKTIKNIRAVPTNTVGKAVYTPATSIRRITKVEKSFLDEAERVRISGKVVGQRNATFDHTAQHKGHSNISLMKKGKAPIGKDGKSVALHHLKQKNDGIIVEMTQKEHTVNSKILHRYTRESEIDRPEFNKWKRKYWKERVKIIEKESATPAQAR